MKSSIRRIANTLLVIGVIGISASLSQVLFLQCVSEARGCLAALSFAGGMSANEYMHMNTLAQTTSALPLEGAGWTDIIGPLSSSLMLIAVFTLIVLEGFELYYLKKILGLRRSFRLS